MTRGEKVTIQRTPSVTSYVTRKRVSNSSDPSTRDAVWQGFILSTSSLVSGELFTIGGDYFLAQTVEPDTSGELLWYAVKTNSNVTHQRYTETANDRGDITQSWVTLNANVKAWGQIVTAKLRAEDPGLLDGAKYIFQAQKSLGITEMDRIVYANTNYRVESVDDIAMAGVVRVQLSVDTR
jgi:hypothetical protein